MTFRQTQFLNILRCALVNQPAPCSDVLTDGDWEALMELAGEQAPGDFAVVAHGGIIAQFLQELTGIWRKPGYAEVIPLIYENGSYMLEEER